MAVVSALVREQRAAAELKRSTTPESKEKSRRTVEEHCIQKVVRSHLTKVQEKKYAEVVKDRNNLKTECATRQKHEQELEQENKELNSQVMSVHCDRLNLLKLVARWQMKGKELLQYISSCRKLEAQASTMREQKKQAIEERDEVRKQIGQLQEDKGALKEELNQVRKANDELMEERETMKESMQEAEALRQKYSQQSERERPMDEWKKLLADNKKLQEECHEMRMARDNSSGTISTLAQDCESLKAQVVMLKNELKAWKDEAEKMCVEDEDVVDLPSLAIHPLPSEAETDSAVGTYDGQSIGSSMLSDRSSVWSTGSSALLGETTTTATGHERPRVW